MELTIRIADQLVSSLAHFLFFSAHIVPRIVRGILFLILPGWTFVEDEPQLTSGQTLDPSPLNKGRKDLFCAVSDKLKGIEEKNPRNLAFPKL